MPKQVTKIIGDDELLVAFAVKEADVPKLVEAICALNGYTFLINNPNYSDNEPESETNLRMIENPVSAKEFAMNWIIQTGYQQLASYKRMQEDLLLSKQREQEMQSSLQGAKPVI